MKKLIALLLTVLLLSTMCTAHAWREGILIAPNPNAAKTVSVRVEGATGNLYDGWVAWAEGMTALSALETALTDAGVEYVIKDSQYGGKYVSAVGGDMEGAFGGYDGWVYYVDGQSPMFSIDACALQGGESLLVAFADMSAVLPILETSRDWKGQVTVTVTADVTTYDEANNWAPVVTRQPMADVKLTVDGAEYVTDARGKALLSAESAAKETVTVQLEKTTEAGAPVVVRLAPGYVLDLASAPKAMPFSDLEEGKWYTPYALEMYDLGVINGLPGGLFGPAGTVTRAQVAKVLFELGGGVPVNYLMTFTDVNQDAWYAEAVRWCAAMGIAQGSEGKFSPDAPVTRQDLAVMLMRYQTNVVKADLPETAEAPAFLDNEQIASYAAEAVYKLQKAGIVQGSEGKFSPTATATRGELCKMLSGLVVSD